MGKKILIFFSFVVFCYLLFPNQILADTANTCNMQLGQANIANGQSVQVTVSGIVSNGAPLTSFNNNFIIIDTDTGRWYTPTPDAPNNNVLTNGSFSLSLNNDNSGHYIFASGSNHLQFVRHNGFGQNDTVLCSSAQVLQVSGQACTINVYQSVQSDGTFNFSATVNTAQLIPGAAYAVELWGGNRVASQRLALFTHTGMAAGGDDPNNIFLDNGTLDNGYSGQTYNMAVIPSNCVEVSPGSCAIQSCTNSVYFDPNKPGVGGSGPGGEAVSPNIACPGTTNTINTAIGCIPIDDPNALIGFFLKWGIGIGGGIAFLLILVAGFQIMTSRGDPNQLKAGQELLTSAIAGLLLLIFSVIILKIIGVDILQLKGFPGS